jgi:hypothetical protein
MASNPRGDAARVFTDCSRRLGGEYIYTHLHVVGLTVVTACVADLRMCVGGTSCEVRTAGNGLRLQFVRRSLRCCGM